MTDSQQMQRRYRKSTRSGGSGGNCVEWAWCSDGVYIRDSKNRQGDELFATAAEWRGLLDAARAHAEHPWLNRRGDGMDVTRAAGRLSFTAGEWTAFIEAINAGECERETATV